MSLIYKLEITTRDLKMNVYQDAKSTKGKSKAQKVIDTGMWEEKAKAYTPDLYHL